MPQHSSEVTRSDYSPDSEWWGVRPDSWRVDLLSLMLRVSLLFGLLVYFPSVYMALSEGYMAIATVDTLSILMVMVLYFFPSLGYVPRACVFALICYILGTVLLITVGPVSQIYLFGFSIVTTLLLGLRFGLVGVAINGVTLMAIGLLGDVSPNMTIPIAEPGPSAWTVLVFNFLLVNSLLVLAVGAVIAMLERSMLRQRSAREAAEETSKALLRANEALAHEVEERVRAEQVLATSEERFRILSQATTDAIWDWDLDSGVLWWNEGFEILFGYHREDIEPAIESWTRHIHPEERDAVVKSRFESIQSGEKHWSAEYRFERKDGGYAHVLDRGIVLKSDENRPVRMVGGMTDLTERKKLERQILRNQRMESIGTLASGIAHDLNNILSPIVMSVELLKKESSDRETLSLIDTLQGSAQRGADLIRQILGFSQGMKSGRTLMNLVTITEEVRRIIGATFPRSIDFELNIAKDIWHVQADPTQLHQVLMNTCVNARDAMPNGGKLTVTLSNIVIDEVFAGMNTESRPGPYIVIKVEDTGVGMSREVQEKIFEPFFTTKELGRGTGLGLSTTFTIVQNHGGFINLYSEPGKGTKFKIYLPAITTPEDVEETSVVQAQLPRGDGEIILLVDDEENIREITKKALERFGYGVILACNGAEAVSLYIQRRKEIAVIVTDMSMPVMDGPAMIVALKSLDPNVRIIGSSGLAANGHVAKALGAGVEYFVPKPYTAQALLTTLSSILGKKTVEAQADAEARELQTNEDPSVEGLLAPIVAGEVKILVVEDDTALRDLARRVLVKAGYEAIPALDGQEALALLEMHGGEVNLILTDLRMPRLDGERLFHVVTEKYPDIRFVISTGGDRLSESLNEKRDNPPILLNKPYSPQTLLRVIREALE